ncbi:MAG: hypothetical protein K0R18_372 [Bacillales bacterium]|jgi:hypothetical protein|nr:hypothetical protein [Bacillales bacterium]
MLKTGMKLYGFCEGYFGRDSYGDKIIEGIGMDWIVAREEGATFVVIAQFENKAERNECAEKWSEPQEEE